MKTASRPGEPLRVTAPAKVNLTLHVTGQRAGGYHDLDSLVVFAGVGDQILARPSTELSLSVTGQFAQGVPSDGSNLILQAASALQERHGVSVGAALTLEKALPHAAGLGSGSSDAAATLQLLAKLWSVPPLEHGDPILAALGADVPVCYAGPAPLRMSGIGDRLSYLPKLPDFALVVVNPRVAVPTAQVFEAMDKRNNAPMDDVPHGLDFAGFCEWLDGQRNDMTEAAIGIAPEIGTALERLRRQPLVKYATMSGSGATCVGVVKDMDHARRAARAMQVAEMSWWVAPAPVLS
ncbi:4-diphosphocytidyl-2C-methyl-D-erythritol kinase [Oceanicola granulosus HTCC2516]|uniref:4-diphosphocytidyl-2-C-methyl-D-erythritol kinase n=1 Tax=Oceanicola granulosus (strain ATCC BAA-861 / DSM 15982 / KCTC 12143 / HTCC2516) TaxID=314256 RepID=Q2CCG3_OCEGH|nr:4-(cytidine 5'-diphospho)-2-C-methyl-D-erythritol kinase [Oceanicola granulosus]EAR50355.1 4-diphosphocytidyl-2C-methyl-D-erythritol kinase [Oceanicola granulosus HTCC2516]